VVWPGYRIYNWCSTQNSLQKVLTKKQINCYWYLLKLLKIKLHWDTIITSTQNKVYFAAISQLLKLWKILIWNSQNSNFSKGKEVVPIISSRYNILCVSFRFFFLSLSLEHKQQTWLTKLFFVPKSGPTDDRGFYTTGLSPAHQQILFHWTNAQSTPPPFLHPKSADQGWHHSRMTFGAVEPDE